MQALQSRAFCLWASVPPGFREQQRAWVSPSLPAVSPSQLMGPLRPCPQGTPALTTTKPPRRKSRTSIRPLDLAPAHSLPGRPGPGVVKAGSPIPGLAQLLPTPAPTNLRHQAQGPLGGPPQGGSERRSILAPLTHAESPTPTQGTVFLPLLTESLLPWNPCLVLTLLPLPAPPPLYNTLSPPHTHLTLSFLCLTSSPSSLPSPHLVSSPL